MQKTIAPSRIFSKTPQVVGTTPQRLVAGKVTNEKEDNDIPLEKAIEITQQLKEKYPQLNQILSNSGDYSTENPIISENEENKGIK